MAQRDVRRPCRPSGNRPHALIKAARRQPASRPASICCLPKRLPGAGARGDQAVTIEWDGVDRLTAWRYGLATATGDGDSRRTVRGTRPEIRWPIGGRFRRARRARARRFAERAAARGVLSQRGAGRSLRRDRHRDDNSGTRRRRRSRAICDRLIPMPTQADRLERARQLWGEPDTRAGPLCAADADRARRGAHPGRRRRRRCRPAGRRDADRRARSRGDALGCVRARAAATPGRCSRSPIPSRGGAGALQSDVDAFNDAAIEPWQAQAADAVRRAWRGSGVLSASDIESAAQDRSTSASA